MDPVELELLKEMRKDLSRIEAKVTNNGERLASLERTRAYLYGIVSTISAGIGVAINWLKDNLPFGDN